MKSILFFMLLILVVNVLVIGCSNKQLNELPVRPFPEIPALPEAPEPIKGEKVKLWATWYNVPRFNSDKSGEWVRDKKGNKLTQLKIKDWCLLAMEGSGYVDGILYNYAGTTRSHRVSGCKYKPSERAKFYVDPKGAVGNKSNALVPFTSIACDQTKFPFGQKFLIPDAIGTKTSDGKIHNGIFRCADRGGLIKGNHIDVFIGSETKNPFSFVKSRFDKTFTAYLLKD